MTLLHDVAAGERPALGRRVLVAGGGDTAIDAARTARRLGAAETVLVYRRTRERMPAHDDEVREARDEAVAMRWLQTVRSAAGHRAVVERIELDADGKPHGTGELTELDADCVVLALGQDADLGLVDGLAGVTVRDGAVLVDADHMTGRPGVFAGGDAIAAARTAATAVGHGRRAAAAIDAWLSGEARTPPAVVEPAVLDGMNTWYFEEAPHVVRGRLQQARRSSSFDEVVHGLTAPDALFEARRCLSCGQCFACDNCFGVCPDAAVIKLEDGGGYAIDLEHCKGCGLCVAECPSGAMRMIEEPA